MAPPRIAVPGTKRHEQYGAEATLCDATGGPDSRRTNRMVTRGYGGNTERGMGMKMRSRRNALIRVLLVHDICLLRTALAALLEREAGIEVASTSWRNARRAAHTLDPHVCVIDAECPGTVERLPSLEGKLTDHMGIGCALVILAAAGKPGQLRRAFEARALGFVDKGRSPQRLATAIRRVTEGKRFVDDSLAPDFLRASYMPFTRRELTVLSLSADGASIEEIARELNLARGTVRNHLAAITRKAGARNRVDAIRISRGAGWV